MTHSDFTLISHHLCPYVQRAAIVLLEKEVPFKRRNVDLGNKPDWFKALSPLGKVPLLQVDGDTVLFESAVISEYVDEVTGGGLLPADPLPKARQRAWIEFASGVIVNIGQLYGAENRIGFGRALLSLLAKWDTVENNLAAQPYFAGPDFSLVDAAFAPVFRYFDTFEEIMDIDFFPNLTKVQKWREALASRNSVKNAVDADFPYRLRQFLARRDSYVGRLMQQHLGRDHQRVA